MVEFRTAYYNTMDREYYERPDVLEMRTAQELGKPIVPINEIGVTVPEIDPTGTHKNLVQGVDANIRAGAGSIQLVMTTAPESAIGGRPKAYGKEIREALKEITRASDVMIKGVEMPTSMDNLSGYNQQQGNFSEEQRLRHLDEVKDAIKFASDINGGGVDIVSFEFERNIRDADWNTRDPKTNKQIFEQRRSEDLDTVPLVDVETGMVHRVRKGEKLKIPYDPKNGKPLIDEAGQLLLDREGLPKLEEWKWKDFVREADRQFREENIKIAPEQVYMNRRYATKIKDFEGWADRHRREARAAEKEIKNAEKSLAVAPEDDKKSIELDIRDLQTTRRHLLQQSQSSLEQAHEIETQLKRFQPIKKYALERSTESYAEAGVFAYDQTKRHPQEHQPIHVGPELGWPHAYGSHPKEFVELIKKSRNIMADKLVTRKGMTRAAAEKAARNHVKGVMDTGHLGMWLEHFQPDNPNWDDRVKKFNKWYIKQMEWLAEENKKHDILGGMQVVDSASAAHGHLPPGQGIFPIKEAVKILREKGNFRGFIVSEGHEEERFGEGRILLKTWEELGSPVFGAYQRRAPGPQTWEEVTGSYLGRTYAPMFMFGEYVPSPDFKGGPFWSGLPLE